MYARAGEVDPKVVVTTSHDPSSRLKMFLKEVRLLVPNAERVNRGSYTTKEIVQACKKNEVSDLIIVHEHRGDPDGSIPYHFELTFTFDFLSSTLSLCARPRRNDVLRAHTLPPPARPHRVFRPQQRGHAPRHRHERNNPRSVPAPHLRQHVRAVSCSGADFVFETDFVFRRRSSLGQRTATILKHIFPVPKAESKRIMTFANRSESIQFRHHLYRQAWRRCITCCTVYCSAPVHQSACPSLVSQKRRGERPGIEGVGAALRHEAVSDQAGNHRAAGAITVPHSVSTGTHPCWQEADVEWAYKPYMNTTKRRKFLE